MGAILAIYNGLRVRVHLIYDGVTNTCARFNYV